MDGRKSFREQLCRKAGVASSVRKVEEARMRWFGHLIRMDGYNYKEYHCETASYRQRGQKMWHRKQMWSALPPPPHLSLDSARHCRLMTWWWGMYLGFGNRKSHTSGVWLDLYYALQLFLQFSSLNKNEVYCFNDLDNHNLLTVINQGLKFKCFLSIQLGYQDSKFSIPLRIQYPISGYWLP